MECRGNKFSVVLFFTIPENFSFHLQPPFSFTPNFRFSYMEFLEGKRKGRSIDAELTPHPPVVRGVVWKYYPQRYNLVLDSHKIGEGGI